MELSVVFIVSGILVALFTALCRPLVVFSGFKPGLVIFRRWPFLRNLLALFSIGLVTAARFMGQSTPAAYVPVAIFLFLAFGFNMDLLFPPLFQTSHLAGVEIATADREARVLGTKVSGISHAFPLSRMVIARHLVHDTVAGVPILASYCALCASGLVFDRRIAGRDLHFRVVGVFRRNLIMADRETRTIWQQATGEAIYGPLKGSALSLLPGYQMSLSDWLGAHPDSTVAGEPERAPFAVFATHGGERMLQATVRRAIVPGKTALGNRVAMREVVFGIEVDGYSRAYPVSELKRLAETAEGTAVIDEQVGSRQVQITYRIAEDSASAEVRPGGTGEPTPYPLQRHWWLGWKEFHPDTTVFSA